MRPTLAVKAASVLVSLGLVSTFAFCATAQAASDFKPLEPQSQLPRATSYAEDVYARIQAASAGELGFEIEALDTAKLEEIRGEQIADLIEIPAHRIVVTMSADAVTNPRFVEASRALLPELSEKVEKFEAIDYPILLGRYRRLEIGVTIGEERKNHQVLEFCWDELDHCALLDPVFLHAPSIVDNHLRLQALGHGKKIEIERAAPKTEGASAWACRPAAHPQWESYSYRLEGFEIEHKDLFGEPVLTEKLGGRRITARCAGDSQEACAPVFSVDEKESSSCEAHDPAYACGACENVFDETTGEARAFTQCRHGLASGPEMVSRNGGELKELCSWTEL